MQWGWVELGDHASKASSTTELLDILRSERKTVRWLEQILWNGKPTCPKCKGTDKIRRHKPVKYSYYCNTCRRVFTVKSNTILHGSNLPVRKWTTAIYMTLSYRAGISSLQLSQKLSITKKSAWFMAQRIRGACEQGSFKLNGTVERDDTYASNKESGKATPQKSKSRRNATNAGPRKRHNAKRKAKQDTLPGVSNAIAKLDQFYTKPEVANDCWNKVRHLFQCLAGDDLFFIEPSAGDGVFYNLLPKDHRVGIDLAPRHSEVLKRDFLKCRYRPPVDCARAIVIGNPPFGKRGKLAVEFINKAFEMADTVAFIVPVIFRKYFIHKQLDSEARLIKQIPLERRSFRTLNKTDYSVNTEFQVWTRLTSGHPDLRVLKPPPILHPDFTMWQYNNTIQALKVFQNIFDFAVPCQGYQDYTRREVHVDKCEKHKQWMLFKANDEEIKDRLWSGLDYEKLAMKHTTTTPGFRKGDVVLEYSDYYD